MTNRTLDELLQDWYSTAYGSETVDVLAEEIGPDATGLMHALYLSLSSLLKTFEGDRNEALRMADEAIGISLELNDLGTQSRALTMKGNVLWSGAELKDAMEAFYAALAISEDLDLRGRGWIFHGIALVFRETGDNEKALEYYERALVCYESDGSTFDAVSILGNTALIYADIDQYERTAELLEEALIKAERNHYDRLRANFYGNLGEAYTHLGENEKAATLLERGINLAKKISMSREVGFYSTTLATLHFDVGDVDKAMHILDDYHEQIALNPVPVILEAVLRARYLQHTGDLEGALSMLEEQYQVCTQIGLAVGQREMADHLLKVTKQMGDFEAYVRYNELSGELHSTHNASQTAQKLALRDKEREFNIERQQQEEERQRMIQERERERTILYSTLPDHVADRLIAGEQVTDHFEAASVIFLDIAGFTSISDKIPPGHVVHLLSQIFSSLDEVCKHHGVTKIKTIGDSYMAVALPGTGDQGTAISAASCAIDMMNAMAELQVTMDPELGDTSWTKDMDDIQVRIGVHYGPITAGVIGTQRLQYDVWGDTVNVASRMESTGEAGRIQVSESFARALCLVPRALDEHNQAPGTRHPAQFEAPGTWHQALTERGSIDIKGKGTMTTYWLEGASS